MPTTWSQPMLPATMSLPKLNVAQTHSFAMAVLRGALEQHNGPRGDDAKSADCEMYYNFDVDVTRKATKALHSRVVVKRDGGKRRADGEFTRIKFEGFKLLKPDALAEKMTHGLFVCCRRSEFDALTLKVFTPICYFENWSSALAKVCLVLTEQEKMWVVALLADTEHDVAFAGSLAALDKIPRSKFILRIGPICGSYEIGSFVVLAKGLLPTFKGTAMHNCVLHVVEPKKCLEAQGMHFPLEVVNNFASNYQDVTIIQEPWLVTEEQATNLCQTSDTAGIYKAAAHSGKIRATCGFSALGVVTYQIVQKREATRAENDESTIKLVGIITELAKELDQ